MRRPSILLSLLAVAAVGLGSLEADNLLFALRVNLAMAEAIGVSGRVNPIQPMEFVSGVQREAMDDEGALDDLRQLVWQNPAVGPSRALGSYLSLLGRRDEAETLLDRGDLLSRFSLAYLYSQRGDRNQALSTFKGVPGATKFFEDAGMKALRNGQCKDGVSLLEMSRLIDETPSPGKATLYRLASETYYSCLKDWEGAVRWAKLWSEGAQKDLDGSMWLAGLYLWRERPEDAYAVLQKAEELGGRNHPLFAVQMGQVYERRGQWGRAIVEYREAVERNPRDPHIAWYLGSALYGQKRFEEARPVLEFVASAHSSRPDLQQRAQEMLQQISRNLR